MWFLIEIPDRYSTGKHESRRILLDTSLEITKNKEHKLSLDIKASGIEVHPMTED